ncbi:phosphoglycolate phosphatase [Spirochaetia bacterium]|nr:phosphoglycolate phosphatase [Spirochaetia bacterium]
MKYRSVIFDLDGTLVNTIADIASSMNHALALHGFPERAAEEYKKIVGWGIKKLAWEALPPEARAENSPDGTSSSALAEAVAADAAQFYAEKPLVHSEPYPGIPELLAELKRKRLRIAVLTNKPDPVARLVVEGLFPGTFDSIRGDTPGAPRKPDPAITWEILVEFGCTPGETIFMGDSEIDMETARNAGCFPLGVSWGYRPRETLEGTTSLREGAALIIDHPLELLDLLSGSKL